MFLMHISVFTRTIRGFYFLGPRSCAADLWSVKGVGGRGVSALGNARVDLHSYGKRFEEIGKGFLSHCLKIHL